MTENENGTALAKRNGATIPAALAQLNSALRGGGELTAREKLIAQSDETEEILLERVKMAPQGKEKFDRGDDEQVDKITGIIIAAPTARAYWETEGTKGVPFCSSNDGKGVYGTVAGDVDTDPNRLVAANNHKVMHPYAVAQVEENRRVSCRTCPLNVFGSGKGGTGKACKEMRRVLIHEEGKKIPIILTLPPTSLAPLKAYNTRLMSDGEAMFTVTTEFGVKRETSDGGFDYGLITLTKGEPISDDAVSSILPLQKAYAAFLKGVEVTDDDYSNGETIDHEPEGDSAPF